MDWWKDNITFQYVTYLAHSKLALLPSCSNSKSASLFPKSNPFPRTHTCQHGWTDFRCQVPFYHEVIFFLDSVSVPGSNSLYQRVQCKFYHRISFSLSSAIHCVHLSSPDVWKYCIPSVGRVNLFDKGFLRYFVNQWW